MKKKKRWPRDEVLYNKVQENEFLNFFDFVKYLGFKVCKTKKMRDVMTCLLIWHKFPNLSSRRAKSLLKLFKKFKIINVKIPCFKTLCSYREEPLLNNILDELIEESSKPLAVIEKDFATDSTGIRTKLFSTWYSLRCKKRIKKRDHLTDHTSIGVKSKIVTAVNVEVDKGKDNVIFRDHVDKTSKNFQINEWSGDGMYWAKANCAKVAEKGGKPYFKCKTGKTAWNGKQGGCPPWKEMNQEYKDNPKNYDKSYHNPRNYFINQRNLIWIKTRFCKYWRWNFCYNYSIIYYNKFSLFCNNNHFFILISKRTNRSCCFRITKTIKPSSL